MDPAGNVCDGTENRCSIHLMKPVWLKQVCHLFDDKFWFVASTQLYSEIIYHSCMMPDISEVTVMRVETL